MTGGDEGRGDPFRPCGAPREGAPAVCPHCWYVHGRAGRLCVRCGADMTLALQESGGLRATAAVQSPVPVRAAARLGPLRRLVVLAFVALLAIGSLFGAFAPALPVP